MVVTKLIAMSRQVMQCGGHHGQVVAALVVALLSLQLLLCPIKWLLWGMSWYQLRRGEFRSGTVPAVALLVGLVVMHAMQI